MKSNQRSDLLPIAHVEQKQVFHVSTLTKIVALLIVFSIVVATILMIYLVFNLP